MSTQPGSGDKPSNYTNDELTQATREHSQESFLPTELRHGQTGPLNTDEPQNFLGSFLKNINIQLSCLKILTYFIRGVAHREVFLFINCLGDFNIQLDVRTNASVGSCSLYQPHGSYHVGLQMWSVPIFYKKS